VAHNASFDYGFIKAEYARLGYTYSRQTLCTKKLSKKLLPDLGGYSLGNLCKALGIKNESRHRAWGDARATVELFDHLLTIEKAPESLPMRGIVTYVPRTTLDSLPEAPGIYFLYNQEGAMIYIGKSISIRDRVLSHLSGSSSKRGNEMKEQIYDVGYELCGSELISLLRESEEIKHHMPRFNRLLRRKTLQWGLCLACDAGGYANLTVRRNDGTAQPLTTFPSKKSAVEFLFNLIDLHTLCQKLCGLYKSSGSCFRHGIAQCNGACTGEESPAEYNERVYEAIEPYTFIHDSFVVIDKGRVAGERSVVLVENRRYCGYGYLPANEAILDPSHLKNFIIPKPDHRDAQQIIRTFMKQEKPERVIRIESGANHRNENTHISGVLRSPS
jgi:DNA polymerase III subunit epsilon